MLTSVLKSQKTSGGLNDLHVNDWKEKKRRVGISTLYSTSRNFQGLNQGPTILKNRCQYNEPRFRFLIKFQNTKNQC